MSNGKIDGIGRDQCSPQRGMGGNPPLFSLLPPTTLPSPSLSCLLQWFKELSPFTSHLLNFSGEDTGRDKSKIHAVLYSDMVKTRVCMYNKNIILLFCFSVVRFVKCSLAHTQDHLKEETFPESELENEVRTCYVTASGLGGCGVQLVTSVTLVA